MTDNTRGPLPPEEATFLCGIKQAVAAFFKQDAAPTSDPVARHAGNTLLIIEQAVTDRLNRGVAASQEVRQGGGAERVMAEAYQVVGSLLSDVGQFGSNYAEKILDNLAQMRVVHDDVLPWPSFATRQGGTSLSDEQIRSLWQTTDTGDAEDDILSFARAVLAQSGGGEVFTDEEFLSAVDSRGLRVDPELALELKSIIDSATPGSAAAAEPKEPK